MDSSSSFISMDREKAPCGRCSCIILYSSEHCLLCDAAQEILQSVLSDFGLSSELIRTIDIASNDDDGCGLPPPVGLPAIRICDELITGLPDYDVARGAVMHTVLKSCFFDCEK